METGNRKSNRERTRAQKCLQKVAGFCTIFEMGFLKRFLI